MMETLTGLVQSEIRAAGGPQVASAAGAERLCIFVRDPELRSFLPGPGFPQRLPRGIQWADFLHHVAEQGHANSKLYSPYTNDLQQVSGFLLSDAAIAVFLGGNVRHQEVQTLVPGLRIVAALLRAEQQTKLADIRASLSHSDAKEAQELAEALSEAHDKLTSSLHARELLLKEVNRKQEQLQLARQISGIGVWELDIAKQAIELSPGACEIFGLSPDCLQFPLRAIIDVVHPEDRERVEQIFSGALRSKREVNLPFRIRWGNGTQHWVENRSTVVRDPGGKAMVVGISLDITQRVLTEEALIRSEKLAAAGRLAATIAHEINNPLEGLVNLIYLARETDDLVQLKELLTTADQELTRVSAVARQALGFYRDINAAVRFDISAAVRQVLDLVRTQLQGNAVSLLVTLPKQSVEIDGWPGEIKQVVSNLLMNSAQASDRGTLIHLRLLQTLREVRLTIADQGHGISQEHLRYIYEPFFTTRTDSGTGLGLWVTRQIVEKHRGRIRVRSVARSERHGTVFMLAFPLAGTVPDLTTKGKHLRDRWLDLNI